MLMLNIRLWDTLGASQFFSGTYKHWVPKKSSGITGRLREDNQFVCKTCNTAVLMHQTLASS